MPRSRSSGAQGGRWDALEQAAAPLWQLWWQKPGDVALRGKLLEHYAPLASRTAWARARSTGQLDRVIDQHDLSQELVLVLAELIECYDPKSFPGVPFHKYAAPRLAKRVVSVERDASFVGRWGMSQGYSANFLSLDQPVSIDGQSTSFANVLVASAAPLEQQEQAYRAQVLAQIDDAGDRDYARRRWFEHQSISQIAEALGKSQSWAFFKQSQVLAKVLRAMGCPELIGRNAAPRWRGRSVPQPQRKAA